MENNSFAVTYTVKNEEKLLPQAMQFYLNAGCSRVYVFWDGTSDNAPSRVRGIHKLTAMESIRPESVRAAPGWINEITPMWATNMNVRKRINTFCAARMAKEAGIEWILSIDPDEIAVPNILGRIERDGIRRFLASAPTDVEQILPRNLDVVPTVSRCDDPFRRCTLFLNRFPLTESIWRYSRAIARRATSRSKIIAWYDFLFYQLRFFGALPRLMRHPETGELLPAGYFLGYSNHKSFVRTSAAEYFNFNIHKWIGAERNPVDRLSGFVLHYDLFDYEYMSQKFRQRSQTVESNDQYCRHMMARIARELSDERVEEFFNKYIVISDVNTIHELADKGIVLEIRSVSEFFENMSD